MNAQTVAAHEVILVSDYAPELETEAKRRWGTVKTIPNTEKQGLSGARNTGMLATTGDVVAFLDDDAFPAPDWIERIGAAFADPAVLGVGGTVTPYWEAGEPGWFPPEFAWVVGCTHSGMPKEPQPVRNVIGANMAFRRAELVAVGGFRTEFGRIQANTAGAEETDLCIQIGARWPDGVILYDPAVAVEHFVPADRGKPRYFFRRCWGEGRSKAVLARMVGSEAGLSEERTYTRSTLPRGVFKGLRETLSGRPRGIERAAMIVAGLAATSTGYLTAPRRQAAGGEDAVANPTPRIRMATPRSPLNQGGVERHVMEVSKRLAERGCPVDVVCSEPGGESLRVEQRDGVEIRSVRAWPADGDWCLAPRAWRELARKPRPDLIHVQSYHTFVAPLAMLRALTLRIPYVVTFHGGGHSSGARNSIRGLQRRLLRPLLRRAARLVAVAKFEIEEYGAELGLPADRFVLIPNGTDLAFSAGTGEAGARRNGRPTIATIGRLERYKGHHRALEAFPEVLAEQPEARLLIVGSGPYEADLRELAGQLGIEAGVEFTSTPADQPEAMAELLRGVSVVVLMSEFETHPLVALEAAAAGCRLVVADASGLGELAADGFARAVPLEEPAAGIAAAVLEELRLPPQSKRPPLSSWDECAEALLELYRTIV